jgi:hypothetical protein
MEGALEGKAASTVGLIEQGIGFISGGRKYGAFIGRLENRKVQPQP